MANKKHFDMLRRGTDVWNGWKAKNIREEIDLSEADLSRASLFKADLSGVDLFRANLRGADLFGTNISGANLIETNLSDANLSDANLSNARLGKANLSNANLSNANLSNARLSKTNLSNANLSNANLSNAIVIGTIFANIDLRMVKGIETMVHQGPSEISTSILERSNGEIPDIFLKGAGLSDTFISYARSLFQSPIQYYTCFISYSSKDELFARRLHNDLQQEGVRCWFAPENMDIGDKIKPRIDESIYIYDKLLLILSKHSITSNWVAYEVKKALSKELRGTSDVLYPVQVDQTILTCVEPWARKIKETRHIGDFEHWTNPEQYQENFKLLLRALNIGKEQSKTR